MASHKITHYRFIFIICLLVLLISGYVVSMNLPSSDRAARTIQELEPYLKQSLSEKGLQFGAPIFIRIFKQSATLELWFETENGQYQHFKTYEICAFSGELGPKLKEGDKQSPEGFYFVNAGRLNPNSRFHLSFNLGFPNQYDRFHGRTGSALMVHGNCVSIGCYAMTDKYISEIYTLAHAALANGQPFFRVHIFPFKLDSENLLQYQSHDWYSFWLNLKEGYDYFNNKGFPPNVDLSNGVYIFNSN